MCFALIKWEPREQWNEVDCLHSSYYCREDVKEKITYFVEASFFARLEFLSTSLCCANALPQPKSLLCCIYLPPYVVFDLRPPSCLVRQFFYNVPTATLVPTGRYALSFRSLQQ